MLEMVKKITSSFLPQTASKLDEVLERIHNEVKEEYENCEDKFQKLKEARAHVLLKLLGERLECASLTSCKNVHTDM